MVMDQNERMKEMEEQQERIRKNVGRIRNKIVVMSGKGGVGKTTVAVNIASGLAKKGHNVGILDVDIHGPNVPKMLGLEGSKLHYNDEGMIPLKVTDHLKAISMSFLLPDEGSPVIWRGPMKISIINQFLGDVLWGDLDYLVIDLPPGTGDETLSIAQLITGAHALIVTTPQDVALLDSRKALNFARKLDMPILGLVENMSGMACPHCGKGIDLFKKGGGERSAIEMGVEFLGRLPIDPNIVLSGDEGIPMMLKEEDSASIGPFNEILDRIEKIME
ncbi:MAG: Mrp/NBP35 family ATP-binding protein [Candidatus Thermoplasmatota archaeon]|nr:Mrp/NBP35 family ATP-binding protein [Candidatus Thermoplasmatota archaeon]